MKTYTKKEFEKTVYTVIKEMNDDELKEVQRGFFKLYRNLKDNTDTLNYGKRNVLGTFVRDVTLIASNEYHKRNNEEVPY